MIYIDGKARDMLIESFSKDMGRKVTLKEVFNGIAQLVKEDAESVDFSGIRDRTSWMLGKVLQSKEAITVLPQSEKFQNIFKNTEFRYEDNKLSLILNGKEVSGNTKFLTTAYIVLAYTMINNFETAGDDIQKVGGAIIEKASELYGLEFAKRCDLSAYQINGDAIREASSSVHAYMPVANILSCLAGMLLIVPDFTQTHQTMLLIASRIAKSPLNVSVGYIYTFVTKCKDLIDIGGEILAKDITNQFAAIGISANKGEE